MTTFSPSDAALEGFRLTREQPRVLLLWALLQFAVSMGTAAFMIGLGGQHLMALEAAGADPSPDPALMMEEIRNLAPLYGVLLLAGLLMMAVMSAAVYRAILEPGESKWGYLRLGADELRLAALKVIYFFIWGAIIFVVVLIAAIAGPIGAGLGGAFGQLLRLFVGLFSLGLLLFIAVRLSLAPAISFAEHRISVFDSWGLTRGYFWRLLGAYTLALAAIVVVALLGMVIFAAISGVAVVMRGGDLAEAGAAFSPDPTSLGSYFTILTVAYLAFAAVLTALYYAVVTAPAAMAYLAIRPRAG